MSAYSTTVLADNPIRYYRLDEASGTSAADLGSQNQTGTYTGGFTLNQTGLIKGDSDAAVLLNGSTGFISVPTTSLPTGSSAFSMEAWVKTPSSAMSGTPLVMWMGTANTNEGVAILYDLGASKWDFGTFATADVEGVSASTSTIYHLVGTYDGTTMKLYVNGSLAASSAVTVNIVAGTASVGTDGQGNWWGGLIDEVAWYNTALSAARVLAHYDAGNPSHRIMSDGYGGVFS